MCPIIDGAERFVSSLHIEHIEHISHIEVFAFFEHTHPLNSRPRLGTLSSSSLLSYFKPLDLSRKDDGLPWFWPIVPD